MLCIIRPGSRYQPRESTRPGRRARDDGELLPVALGPRRAMFCPADGADLLPAHSPPSREPRSSRRGPQVGIALRPGATPCGRALRVERGAGAAAGRLSTESPMDGREDR